MNPVTGEKEVIIGGNKYRLRFNWKALAEIEHKYGDKPNFFDPEIIAEVAAAGFRESHPEMTAERIKELSPPFILFVRDVRQALQWAYFGAESLPADTESVKKNLPKDGCWHRLKRLLKLE